MGMVNLMHIFVDLIPVQKPVDPVEVKVLDEEAGEALPSHFRPTKQKLKQLPK
jgi:hypothetical protein